MFIEEVKKFFLSCISINYFYKKCFVYEIHFDNITLELR